VATIFSLPNDKFDEIITKFPALLKRIEKRGRAVYGARWNAWSDLAQVCVCMYRVWSRGGGRERERKKNECNFFV